MVFLEVRGDVDLANADEFRAAMRHPHTKGHRLVIDLSRCTFFDASAISALIATYNARGRKRLPLVLPPNSFIRRLLAITSTEALFILHERPEDVRITDG